MPTIMAKIKHTNNTKSWRTKDQDQPDLSDLAVGLDNGISALENIFAVSYQVKHICTALPSDHTHGYLF